MMTVHTFKVLFSVIAVSAAMLPNMASAMPIDKTLNIRVFQLCDDAGNNCASTGPASDPYFSASTNKIWAQAGISVTFTFMQQINSSQFLDLNDDVSGDGFFDLHAGYGTMGASTTLVDMFLINEYAGAYGVGWYGVNGNSAGGLVMSMSTIMSFDCGGASGCIGRIDTLAHEIGHNFGLIAATDPFSLLGDESHSTDNNQLMGPGQTRNVPTTLSDINPDGLGLDQLSSAQIALARSSTLLSPIPEPETYALMLAGLGLVGFIARRQRRNQAV